MIINSIIRQIKLNCNISDAHFWGYYSICGLLMKLRELYRNEKSLMPWDVIPQGLISEWIASTEALWRDLEDKDLHPLEVEGTLLDPFEVDRLNDFLAGRRLVYAAGYGRFNKPTFFLAESPSLQLLKLVPE